VVATLVAAFGAAAGTAVALPTMIKTAAAIAAPAAVAPPGGRGRTLTGRNNSAARPLRGGAGLSAAIVPIIRQAPHESDYSN
jgi:hypothetical protein